MNSVSAEVLEIISYHQRLNGSADFSRLYTVTFYVISPRIEVVWPFSFGAENWN